MKMGTELCETDDCVIQRSSYETVATPYVPAYKDTFEIAMHLSDHTGTLDMCRMSSMAAERTVAIKPSAFPNVSDEDRGRLKWRLLLERCKVKLLVKLKTPLRFTTIVTVLDCVPAHHSDVLANIKAY